jgi:hypothetical protein
LLDKARPTSNNNCEEEQQARTRSKKNATLKKLGFRVCLILGMQLGFTCKM